MEIKGKIKEISLTEKQAKVILHPMPDFPNGVIISSNQPVQMQSVRLMSEGVNVEGQEIVADCYVSQGKRGSTWEGRTFYNINSIEMVIQRDDEVPDSKRDVVPETEPEFVSEVEEKEALKYTPESATMEIGTLFIKLLRAYGEYDRTFKK